MKSFRRYCIPLCLFSLLFVSCATPSFDRVDYLVYESDFSGARAVLEDEKSELYNSADAVLYCLDSGILSHYARDFEASNTELTQAEQLIFRNFATSVTQTIGTYLVNDSLADYAGEDYEDIYTNIFMALNYCRLGKIDDAFVEIRRFDNKQKALATKYGDALSAARTEGQNGQVPDYGSSVISFHNSALARYISMLLYRTVGDFDSAKLDMRFLNEAFSTQKQLYSFSVPASVKEELSVPRGMARVNAICFSGLGPEKIEEVMRLPLGPDRYFKLALPVLRERPSSVRSIRLSASDGSTCRLEKIESITAIARDTFTQKQALIYFRSAIRSLAKSASSVALDAASRETSDGTAALFLSIFSLGSQLYNEVSEAADLRISRYFPSTAWVGGMTLEPGVYSFTVEYLDGKDRVIATERFTDVNVSNTALNLLESICLK